MYVVHMLRIDVGHVFKVTFEKMPHLVLPKEGKPIQGAFLGEPGEAHLSKGSRPCRHLI